VPRRGWTGFARSTVSRRFLVGNRKVGRGPPTSIRRVLALSTGHEIGLGVTAAVFIAFALASAFLFPRWRPDYPGRGMLAFIVVSFVFFFGMLGAVEVFGAEEEHAAETTHQEPSTTAPGTTTQQTTTAPATTAPATTAPATTAPATTSTAPKPEARTVEAIETEFKIALPSTDFKAGKITFQVKNEGKIEHDLAVKETGDKTKLIPPGGTVELTVTLQPGKYEVYCTVPGHEAAGMKIEITVT
jgi:uncharacterized cupredoxin-like copper-binding protein